MEKRRQIDAEDLKDTIRRYAYPIGFDYDQAFALKRSDFRGTVVNAGMLYGLRSKDIMTVIDEMPSANEPGGALEKLREEYDELAKEHREYVESVNKECIGKKLVFEDMRILIRDLTDRGITMSNDQFLESLKRELDNPSFSYYSEDDECYDEDEYEDEEED